MNFRPINRELDIDGGGGGELVDHITKDYLAANAKKIKENAENKNIPSGDIKDFAMYILSITNRVAMKKGVNLKMMTQKEAEELINDLWKKYKYDVEIPT